ncbi:FkbM family methyltransferase [Rhodoplanes serenus]|jgi:FkbM family methyltransferase|uniref:FkbM family methyltransferase n=1 Tax=Rhodoplanes serenus TaxID=200615 RepID=UPI000DADD1D2|nr:FkbM family methyltransferase [Rhodoplanes serenus]RAI31417.1 hypothetical protein CH340_18715 [Rhodoplanes serenus]
MLRSLFSPAVFRSDVAESGIISDYFSDRTGLFVEVGAFEPVALSQTFALEQAGWTGILIEPVPAHAAALRAQRRARVFECACVSPAQDGQMLTMVVRGGTSSLCPTSTSDAEKQIVVRGVTLDRILAEAGIGEIDFLSIDVEGFEIEVLKGLSLDRVRPHLILLEDFADDDSRHRYMVAEGYKRVRRTGNNSWYVDRATPFPVSLFGRWQLLRKYRLSMPVRRIKRILRRASVGRG